MCVECVIREQAVDGAEHRWLTRGGGAWRIGGESARDVD